MKASIKILGMALCAFLVFGCSKNDTATPLSPEETLAKYLTSDAGNRVWRLSKVYVNGIEQTLTIDQRAFTKTYTRSVTGQTTAGTFLDSDGYRGTWVVASQAELIETITNNPSGNVRNDYIINSLTQFGLDVELTANGTTTRYVFYAI